MTITRTRAILLGVLVVAVLVIGIGLGHGCPHEPPVTTTVVTGIDAGPGDQAIDERLDGAVQMDEERMRQVEAKFDNDLRSFDTQQREEYERLRGGDDLDAAAQMLSDWNRIRRARKTEAGT